MDPAGMKHSMMSGIGHMQKVTMTSYTDKDFATLMKMHHQQGVDMAQRAIAHGKSPAMIAMAKNIISAQKKENAELDAWLAKQKYRRIQGVGAAGGAARFSADSKCRARP